MSHIGTFSIGPSVLILDREGLVLELVLFHNGIVIEFETPIAIDTDDTTAFIWAFNLATQRGAKGGVKHLKRGTLSTDEMVAACHTTVALQAAS